jgi:NOL1/NOP2/fmu family ribosome biogenesis protein
MMQNVSILNKKEIKNILARIKDQFDIEEIKLDYVFMRNPKEKIYIANKEIFNLDFEKLRINSIGMYFGQIKEGRVRLSIEGAQLIGKHAKKNVVELDDVEARQWLKGIDLDKSVESKGFVIIKNNKDILGCGKSTGEKIWNYTSKARRIHASD